MRQFLPKSIVRIVKELFTNMPGHPTSFRRASSDDTTGNQYAVVAQQVVDIVRNPAKVKLNIGCGVDYREGFINIDGSDKLPRIDQIIDLSQHTLTEYFEKISVDYILANDIIEHFFHWEAVNLLTQCYELLTPKGILEIRVPDCIHIISSSQYTDEHKLILLFGGQDVPQGHDKEMDLSRINYPQFFCHKYGWSMERMTNDLKSIGFGQIECTPKPSDFVTLAVKHT